MDYMRQLHSVGEHIKQLELEKARICFECDTLRYIFHCKGLRDQPIDPPQPCRAHENVPKQFNNPQLSTSISLSPLSALKAEISESKNNSRPTKESHPNIRFWTIEAYKNWLGSPEAQHTQLERGQISYIEELNGTFAPRARIGKIRSCMRSVWKELASKQRAPQTYGGLDASSYKYFHNFVETAYPLFKCAENGWKLDRLGRATYPSWRCNYLDINGNLIFKYDRKRRREAKQGKTEDLDEGESLFCRKRQRVLSENRDDAISTSEESSATASASTTAYSPPSESTSSQAASVLSNSSGSEILAKTPAKPSSTPESGVGSDNTLEYVNPLCNLARVISSLDITVPDKTVAESIPLTTITEPAAPDLNASELNPPPLIPEIPNSSPVNITQFIPLVPAPSQPGSGKTRAQSDGGKKLSKMRVGKGKNGRNLCAHRWLKAFKETTGGTSPEFNEYYRDLSREQQKAYDKEAEELVTKNAWDKEAFNGTIY